MTTKDRLDYLTVQMKRLANGEQLKHDSLDLMLYQLELLSSTGGRYTIFEFVEQLCDIIGGARRILSLREVSNQNVQEMSTSHEEYQNMLDSPKTCSQSARVNESCGM